MYTRNRRLIALGLILAAAVVGCSSNKDSNPVKSPGGTTHEFASGDLSTGESFTHVFMTAKSVPYFCRYHGSAGGVGMAGVITVTAGGTPSSHAYSITNSTLPSATIDVGDTVTWTNNTAILHTVESDN
jgi:plastocyanin